MRGTTRKFFINEVTLNLSKTSPMMCERQITGSAVLKFSPVCAKGLIGQNAGLGIYSAYGWQLIRAPSLKATELPPQVERGRL